MVLPIFLFFFFIFFFFFFFFFFFLFFLFSSCLCYSQNVRVLEHAIFFANVMLASHFALSLRDVYFMESVPLLLPLLPPLPLPPLPMLPPLPLPMLLLLLLPLPLVYACQVNGHLIVAGGNAGFSRGGITAATQVTNGSNRIIREQVRAANRPRCLCLPAVLPSLLCKMPKVDDIP